MKRLIVWGMLLVAIPVLLLTLVSNIIEDVWNAFTGIPGDIKRFVRSAVDAVLGVIRESLDWLGNNVRDLWGSIESTARGLTGFINDVYRGAIEYARGSIDWLRDRIFDALHAVEGWAHSAVDWLSNRIGDLASWVAGSIADVFRWVNENVLQPLWHGIQDLGAWVNDHVFQPLWQFAQRTWDHVLRGFEDIFGKLGDILSWLWNVGYKVAELVLHAAEWLAFFALHTFTWFTKLFTDVLSRGPGIIIDAIADGIAKEGSHLEDLISRWLGE